MSIATATFYDRSTALMLRMSDRADQLQTQIATGKKLVSASDDAAGYQRLATIKRQEADATATTANLALAGGLLAQTDTVLGNVDARLQRASELAVQANSGILSTSDRAAIAIELDTIRDELVSIANTRDSRGQPLFGGASEGDAFIRSADGSVDYAGSAAVSVPVGDQRQVQATESGADVFMPAGGTDIFAALATLSTAVRAGDSAAIGSANDDIQAAMDHVSGVRASVGARAIRVDLETERRTAEAADREIARSAIEDVDVTETVTELQKTLTILQATQSSFTRLSQLSLFDQLR
ncbi:flagellar hook-associated protein FlgL [Sphingomonas sp. CJ99]